MKKELLVLIFIFFLAFILRFYQLGKIPPNIDWDEAALGYNAYSLLKTGRDEYGVSWPLVFRSFDDYKPPLYFYLTMPSVAIFGLNEFSVRLPSALFGTLTVLVTYFLVRELFNMSYESYKPYKTYRTNNLLPLLSAGLLAISPWHLYFSRIGFEANVGIFFNVLGVYLFLRALNNGWLMIPAAVVFALGLYEYHSERIFIPLLVFGLLLTYRKKLLKIKKQVVIAGLTMLVLVLPAVKIMTAPENLMRFQGTSSFADQTGLLERNIVKLEDAQKKNDWLGMIFANRRITYAQVLINGYLSHFNFNWLFISGDQERHKAPGVGLLYWWELPFLLTGIYYLLRSDLDKKIKYTVFWWFLVAPVAASPTTELPHAVRTLVFLPTFQIFTAYGVISVVSSIKNQVSRRKLLLAVSCWLLAVGFNFFYFFHQYFIHLPLEFSQYWQYGYKQAVEYVQENYDKYDKIIVSSQLEQPHIFFLFFLKYPPEKYLAEGGTTSGGFEEYRNRFDKFEFRRISWENEEKNSRILFIGPPNEIPGDGDYWIEYLDGTRAIEIKHG